MKKLFAIGFTVAMLFACSGAGSDTPVQSGEDVESSDVSLSSSYSSFSNEEADDVVVSKNSSSSMVPEQDLRYSSAVESNNYVSGIVQIEQAYRPGNLIKVYEVDTTQGSIKVGKLLISDTIIGGLGEYKIEGIPSSCRYVVLFASGRYTGTNKEAQVSLSAIADLSENKTVNLNMFTKLEYHRVLSLMDSGYTMDKAKKQAEMEVLNVFGIKDDIGRFDKLNLREGSSGSVLLAISVLLSRDYDILNAISADIKTDGELNSDSLKATIVDWAIDLEFSDVYKAERSRLGDAISYTRAIWHAGYGLNNCGPENNNELIFAKNAYSVYYDTLARFICKDSLWVFATDFEKDTYHHTCDEENVGEVIRGEVITKKKYYCSTHGWLSMYGWTLEIPKEAYLNPEVEYDSIVDPRDGQVYKTVTIGSQVWMSQNLNYEVKGSFEYKEGSSAVFGRLYKWNAAVNEYDCQKCSFPDPVQGACPPGWHIPSRDEWKVLVEAVGDTFTAAVVLKAQTSGSFSRAGTDDYGFSALSTSATDDDLFFWSSTDGASIFAYGFFFPSSDVPARVRFTTIEKNDAVPVRCLKDTEGL